MAAYAAVISLMNTVEQIENHPRHSIIFDKKQVESIQKKIGFLQDFLESYSPGGSKEAEILESQIASAAHAAEDVIESHVVDQILSGFTAKSTISLLDLQKVVQDMDSIMEKVMEVKEERGFKDDQLPTYSRPLTTEKSTMVGFDDYLIQLMDTLTGQQSSRQIIPIVGMGGIGKTTLAKNAYENLVIVQHFDIRAWATVSQEYSPRKILLELLRKQENSENIGGTEDQLGEQLYKILSGRRYLIILDDIWSSEIWDRIKFFFPDNRNRSRIIVTTRQSNVAIQFGSTNLTLNFLDEDSSWNLFCEKTFAQESCPPALEEIGKNIVKRCKGLPLSIVVIGGLLGKSSRTQAYWENIANDINSILNSSEDKQCLNILSLSYNQLPTHLKPCFLYMGTFPEDHEIRVSELIKLWVAEGFLKLKNAKSLEEVAEGYLKDLVDRNLILVRRLGSSGKIKSCSVHDLLRDLCLRVGEKEKFFCVMSAHDIRRSIDCNRRIVFHKHATARYQLQVFNALKSPSHARSLICYWGTKQSLKFRLLRVLNWDINEGNTFETIFQQVNLRYLACWTSNSRLPSSISLLWNIQTLIIRGYYHLILAPSEIWYMPQLRHLQIDHQFCLPDPPPIPDPTSSDRVDQQDDFVLRNLQTLLTIVNFKFSDEVCKRIPNVKKLYVTYKDFSMKAGASYFYCLHNLGCLQSLESLKCSFSISPRDDKLSQNLTLPSSIKKLSLSGSFLHWKDLTKIGSLPHLEVLKLDRDSVVGPEWNPVEGGFRRLKFLGICDCADLIHWNGDSSHFPVLEQLVLRRLFKLDEIPSGVGEIPTLRLISLDWFSNSAAAISAMKILEEQENLGNEGLQVRVQFWDKEDLESFRKNELQSFTCNNVQLVREEF